MSFGRAHGRVDESAAPTIWEEKGLMWYTLVIGQGVCLDEICQILVQRAVTVTVWFKILFFHFKVSQWFLQNSLCLTSVLLSHQMKIPALSPFTQKQVYKFLNHIIGMSHSTVREGFKN